MDESDKVYKCGLRVGDRVRLVSTKSKYNCNMVKAIPVDTGGVVEAPCNDNWPNDAVQVRFDGGGVGAVHDLGGAGAVEDMCLENECKRPSRASRTEVDSCECLAWPETRAFFARLGVPLDGLTRNLSVDFKMDCVVVRHEFLGSQETGSL